MLSTISVLAAAAPGVVTRLPVAGNPAIEIAQVLFALFLVGLIAAGLRRASRGRPHA